MCSNTAVYLRRSWPELHPAPLQLQPANLKTGHIQRMPSCHTQQACANAWHAPPLAQEPASGLALFSMRMKELASL